MTVTIQSPSPTSAGRRRGPGSAIGTASQWHWRRGPGKPERGCTDPGAGRGVPGTWMRARHLCAADAPRRRRRRPAGQTPPGPLRPDGRVGSCESCLLPPTPPTPRRRRRRRRRRPRDPPVCVLVSESGGALLRGSGGSAATCTFAHARAAGDLAGGVIECVGGRAGGAHASSAPRARRIYSAAARVSAAAPGGCRRMRQLAEEGVGAGGWARGGRRNFAGKGPNPLPEPGA